MHDQHEMQLETTHPSGAEEWACPTCGRRFLMQWPPSYKKVILEAGDEYAFHSCGKGGISIAPALLPQQQSYSSNLNYTNNDTDQLMEASPDTSVGGHADELLPWLKWLRDANLDN